ncbi:replication factor C subunit 5-like protein, partial [Dinothrombium tinctorium]
PYTFLETREKVNISWNIENGTVSYQQMKRWKFLPSLTNGSLEDIIVHLNVPLVATVNEAKQHNENDRIAILETVNVVVDDSRVTLFPHHTVRELFFDGYSDEFLQLAKSLGKKDVPDRFGLLYEKNNSASDGIFRIFGGEAETMHKLGLLDAWNNQKKLSVWNHSNCDRIDQSTPGDLRPPFSVPKQRKVELFVSDFCRSIPLTLLNEIRYNDLKLDRFWVSNDVFNYSHKDNKCYCYNQK